MDRSIDASFADEKVMVYNRDMVFSQLYICCASAQRIFMVPQVRRTKLSKISICSSFQVKTMKNHTSTYDAPRLAAATND